ncbi:unnamed protein product [Sphagnum tenellum]
MTSHPMSIRLHSVYLASGRRETAKVDLDALPSDTKNMGPEGFAVDMRRVWKNCRKYNDSSTSIYVLASRYLTKFEALWETKVLPMLRPHPPPSC